MRGRVFVFDGGHDLRYGAVMTIKDTVTRFSRQPGDTGSPEVQIALLTRRIGHLSEHARRNANDHSGRRGLVAMVSNRRSLLRYLRRVSLPRYASLIARLGLRR